MFNLLKKHIGAISAFILTTILLLIIFYESGILRGTILISDLNAEYQPLLMQVRRILTSQMGIFNLNTGMGDNFIGTFYYYMSSPLNILTIFIKNINLLVIILVTLKLSLSSMFAYLFLKYQFKEEKIYYLIICSLLYSLSSFSIAYYFHIMWLDIYMLFPLLLLGIDKIIKEKKHLLYVISLILIIFCNYYFAYMICLFSFIYYNYKILINKISIKEIIKKNLHFILVTALSCLVASITLLPVASEITTYSRQNSMLFGGEKLSFNFDILKFIKYIVLGNISDIQILNDYDFFIFTSIIVLPLLYLYFVNKNIQRREKILSGIILLILLLSISCNYLNYAWHGFVPPSFFNGRYTFMFILFMVMLCYKSLVSLYRFNKFHYIIMSILILQPLLLVANMHLIKISVFDITKIILLISFIIFIIKIPKNENLIPIFCCLIIFEININCFTYLDRYNFDSSTGNIDFKDSISYIKSIDDNTFYRIEDNNDNSNNYSILYNYHSVDYFMSTVKKDLINFFLKLDLGNHAYTKNTISYDGNYHLISSLLNIKYFIDMKNINNTVYTKINRIKEYNIYENKYSLNLGYMVNKDILNTKLDSNGLDNINKIYKGMSGNSVLKKVELDKIDSYNYTFNNNEKKDFYVLIKLNGWYLYSDLQLYINDLLMDNDNKTFNYYVNNSYEKNKDINIRISANEGTIDDIEGVYVYYIDNKQYEDSINYLKEQQLKISNIKNNKIVGEIDVKDDNILFTSIPYSNDLDIYVDGKKQDKIKLLNTFLGTKLNKGKHKIVIKYTPKVLYISLIPSFIGSILLYLYLKIYKKKLAKN